MFILLYHQIATISPEQDPLHLSVSPDLFERQMRYLHSKGYACMPLKAVIKAQLSGDQLPSRIFSITFDDGYQDNHDQAYPIMMKYGFTATIFLVPDCVGGATGWWGLTEKQKFPLMSWDTVRVMSANGIDFGSHSRSHALMDDLTDVQIAFELQSSKEIIENEIGKSVELFAFPYEKSSPELQREVEKHGYLAACGSLRFPENRFNLWRRQCFGNISMFDFRLMISDIWRQSVRLKYHTPFGNSLRLIRRRLVSEFNQ